MSQCRSNTTVGNVGNHCHKNHLWFNGGWMFGKIRHCTRNGYDLQTWISSLSYTKFGIEIGQWQKRAVTWEVRKVQMVLNFPTVALLNTWMVFVHLQKKKKKKNEDLMLLKQCDWIIFFQVPWYISSRTVNRKQFGVSHTGQMWVSTKQRPKT